jgi:hypothetical protein
MEVLEKFIFIIAGIVCLIVLVSIGWNLFKVYIFQGKMSVYGDKMRVLDYIIPLIYKCFNENKDRRTSIICFKVDFKSNQEILSSDIINNLNPSKIDKKNVVAEDLGFSGKIIIRYENQYVYVKKAEIEVS